jgi:hypothetical protein
LVETCHETKVTILWSQQVESQRKIPNIKQGITVDVIRNVDFVHRHGNFRRRMFKKVAEKFWNIKTLI